MGRRGLLAGLALLAGCTLPGAGRMFFGAETVARPEAADCEHCHQEVYQEWQGSGHARAWEGDAFQRASLQGRADACAGCHAPAPVDAAAPVVPRETHRAEGVTCTSCHLSTRPGAAPLTMRGPASRTSPIEVHPIVEEDPFYRSSDLCGRCHEAELSEWRAAAPPPSGEKDTCQGCHMPAVRRKVESVHDEHGYSALFVALGREQELRRHDFGIPADAADWIDVEVRTAGAGGAIEVTIRNRLPHALPTGAYGPRRVRLHATWPGGRTAWPVADAREPIEAGRTRREVLQLAPDVPPADVTVRLERWSRLDAAWTPLFQGNAELP